MLEISRFSLHSAVDFIALRLISLNLIELPDMVKGNTGQWCQCRASFLQIKIKSSRLEKSVRPVRQMTTSPITEHTPSSAPITEHTPSSASSASFAKQQLVKTATGNHGRGKLFTIDPVYSCYCTIGILYTW